MSKSIRIPALAKIAAALEARMEATRPADDADAKAASLAWVRLSHAVFDALEALDAIGGRASLQEMADAETAVRMGLLRDSLLVSLPPISGGAPAGRDEQTPIEVLAASEPRWEPSPEDWADYFAC